MLRRPIFRIQGLLIAGLASAFILMPKAFAGNDITLFKVITVKDEIVVGLSSSELAALGGTDVDALSRAIARQGSITLWQYAVRKGSDGSLEQAPFQRVGVLGHATLRIEPYNSPLRISIAQ